MKIDKLCLIALTVLITACTNTEDPEVIEYIPPEQIVLDRPAKDRAKTLTELGLAYYKLEKYQYAQEYLDRSLEIDDRNATTYQVYALIKQRSNKNKEAEKYFKKALKLEPENYDILTAYAVFLYEQNRHAEALAEFTRIVDAPFFKKKWVAYSYLGLYDLENNLQRDAEINFYKALQANPEYSLALYETAKIRYAKGDMMPARAFIERYFAVTGKTLAGLELAIKIETALQSYDLVEQYQLELTRNFPFSDAAEKIKHNY